MTGKDANRSIARFGQGDSLSFVLDMGQRTMTVSKNGAPPFHTFSGLEQQQWWPAICLDYTSEKVEVLM